MFENNERQFAGYSFNKFYMIYMKQLMPFILTIHRYVSSHTTIIMTFWGQT